MPKQISALRMNELNDLIDPLTKEEMAYIKERFFNNGQNIMKYEGENDFKLVKGAGSVWVTVNKISVWLLPVGDGLRVEVYRKGKEMDTSLAHLTAH